MNIILFDKSRMNNTKYRTIATAGLLLSLIVALASCTRKVYVPVESVRTEYREADTSAIFNRLLKIFEARKEKESRSDSLVDRTKETVVLNEKGDTAKHYKTQYIYLSTNRETELEQKVSDQDSIIKDLRTRLSSVKVDSIPVPYPVEKKLTKWEQAKIDFGGMAMGGAGVLFIGLCIAVVWMIKKHRK